MAERILNQGGDELAEALDATTQVKLEFSGPLQPWHFKLSQNVVAFVLDVFSGINSRTITFPQLYNVSPDVRMEEVFSGAKGFHTTLVAKDKYPCTPSDYEAILAELDAIKGTCFTCELLPKPNGQPSIRLNFRELNDSCPRFQAIFDARKKEVMARREKQKVGWIKIRDEVAEQFLDTAVYSVRTWDRDYPTTKSFRTQTKEFDLGDYLVYGFGAHLRGHEVTMEDWRYWETVLNQKSDGMFTCRFMNNEWTLGVAEQNGRTGNRFIPARRTGFRCRIIE